MLLPPIAGTLLGRLHIRRAVLDDIPACDRIARQHPAELGWVRRVGLAEAQQRARRGGKVRERVLWRCLGAPAARAQRVKGSV